jgi:hypothetical protein
MASEKTRTAKAAVRATNCQAPWVAKAVAHFGLENTIRKPCAPKRDDTVLPAPSLPSPVVALRHQKAVTRGE